MNVLPYAIHKILEVAYNKDTARRFSFDSSKNLKGDRKLVRVVTDTGNTLCMIFSADGNYCTLESAVWNKHKLKGKKLNLTTFTIENR